CLAFAPVARAADPDPTAEDEKVLKSANVSADNTALLEFFKKRTFTEADRGKIEDIVRKLGDDNFTTREKASEDLTGLGAAYAPLIRQALRTTDADVEVLRRLEKALTKLEPVPSNYLAGAAARLAGHKKPDGLDEVLLAYLPDAPDEEVVEEIRTALAAVAFVKGDHSKVLAAALEDKSALRRSVAAEALVRSGPARH